MGLVRNLRVLKIGKKYIGPFKARQQPIQQADSNFRNSNSQEQNLLAIQNRLGETKGFAPIIAPTPRAIFEQGKFSFLVNAADKGKAGGRDGKNWSNHGPAGPDQRLLESFRTKKNAEWKECWRRSEISHLPDGDEDQVGEVFTLTRSLLTDALGPLNDRVIRNEALLEEALGKIHRRLPMPVRIILRKKRYIEFILTHRERLLP